MVGKKCVKYIALYKHSKFHAISISLCKKQEAFKKGRHRVQFPSLKGKYRIPIKHPRCQDKNNLQWKLPQKCFCQNYEMLYNYFHLNTEILLISLSS